MIDLNGLKLKNRFIIASGAVGYGRGYRPYENPISFLLCRLGLVQPLIFGGAVTKTLTILAWPGNYLWHQPWKVLKKISGGWLNRFGWTNCGLLYFLERIYPRLRLDNLIVSLGALLRPDEILEMIRLTNRVELLALELNLSCPHVNIVFKNDYRVLRQLFKQAVKESRHPLIVKLGPLDNPVLRAKLAEDQGINALTAVNTLNYYRPGFGYCGVSGPKIKDLALKTVADIASQVSLPVIGGGGILRASDCQEFFSAGAQAVFFASIFFTRPLAPARIIKQLS